jgi:hypothetical protein
LQSEALFLWIGTVNLSIILPDMLLWPSMTMLLLLAIQMML